MADLKSVIKKDVGRRQRGLKIRSGDFFMRGSRPVEILDREGGAVHFLDMITGKEAKIKHGDFHQLGPRSCKNTPADKARTFFAQFGATQAQKVSHSKIVLE